MLLQKDGVDVLLIEDSRPFKVVRTNGYSQADNSVGIFQRLQFENQKLREKIKVYEGVIEQIPIGEDGRNSNLHKIINILQEKDWISVKELKKYLEISERTIRYHLAKLKKKGLVIWNTDYVKKRKYKLVMIDE